MVKTIHVRLDEEEHERLKDEKGDRTWKEVLLDGAGKDSEANA